MAQVVPRLGARVMPPLCTTRPPLALTLVCSLPPGLDCENDAPKLP